MASVAMAEESGAFFGAGIGRGSASAKITSNGVIIDGDGKRYGAGLSFDVLAGYKQFFTQNFGLRYYANFTYASFTTYERSGETNAMNELWCEY